MNGKSVLSCLILACDIEGKEILTIEGLSKGETLDPIQEAFIEHGAVQCGFCTPGMIMNLRAFLEENPAPTNHEIRDAIKGNLCRCTGYAKIVEAVEAVVSGRMGDK